MLIGIPIVIFILVALCFLLSAVVWLPDLASPDAEHIIGRCVLQDGQSVELTQRWVGDGYLTGVRHRLRDGTSVFAVGDGDAARAFGWTMSVRANNNFVTFRFGAKQWRYDWRAHSLSCDDGRTREAI